MVDLKARYLLVVVIALVVGVASPAAAQSAGALEARGANASLGALFKASMKAASPQDVTITKLDNGLTKMVVPVSRTDGGSGLVARQAGPLLLLVLVHEISEPDLFAETVSFDFAPIAFFPYFYGWVVLNEGPTANKKTTVIRKGPGSDIRLVETLTYEGGSFILFFLEDAIGAAEGKHKYSVKVSNAGAKLKANMCAGCAG